MTEYVLNETDMLFEELEKQKDWWENFVKDPDVYIDIRKGNKVHIYCNGGRIFELDKVTKNKDTDEKKINTKINSAYIPIKPLDKKNDYLSCSIMNGNIDLNNPIEIDKNLNNKISQIKKIVKMYNPSYSEKGIQGAYATVWKKDIEKSLKEKTEKYGFFLDTEFADGDARIDLVYLHHKDPKQPKIYFVELKTKGDDRLWNNEICEQLKKYNKLIATKRSQLIEYYQKLYRIKEKLNLIPKNLGIDITNLKIEDKPILLIGDANEEFITRKVTDKDIELDKSLKNKKRIFTEQIVELNNKVSDYVCMVIYRKSTSNTINFHRNTHIFRPNKPNLIIHKGTQQIGGCAVEINNGNTKLLFDFGIPLDSMEKESYKLEDYKLPIKGLYKDEAPEFNAVFLTHAHPDHFGLMKLINNEIPIYVSETTYNILTKITPFLPNASAENLNLHIIKDDIVFENIKVKAHRVDHSIAGALAYEIETDGKTIVYTGDVRFHGRASWQSSVFKRAIKNPDYLIMEGTTLGRAEQNIVEEEDLESKFIEIFKGDKLPLVQFSPQNIDRLVTVYRACKRTGKTLVIDPYTAYVMEVYSSLSKNIPQFDWDNIMVNFAHSSINNKLAEEKRSMYNKNLL